MNILKSCLISGEISWVSISRSSCIFRFILKAVITGCDKKIKFVSPQTIEILYDEYNAKEVYTVELSKIRFK
ncbi:hypothetical protein U0035_22315 [Niabella yanshanensis]|uniref:Uncharacterized protein n=1 Tax=Niabella yanshanensis TaxID=577386 RepID=A0ABZ0W7E8_9BACT|nr:hypothetical protein [Niabella yanshanensis]WQD38412.1 hypothetical protein U0035_22315 [Niabella yanshanensis]